MYVQLVQFKLLPDTQRDVFLALTEQLIRWLKTRPGFIAYELYENQECWSDRIAWTNEAYAREGLSAFISSPVASQLLPLIAKDYHHFFGQAALTS
jgi:quinol monooxygenase YgiN